MPAGAGQVIAMLVRMHTHACRHTKPDAPPRAHLVRGGGAVGLAQAGEHLAQRARGPPLLQKARLVPVAQEEPACMQREQGGLSLWWGGWG